LQEGRTILPQTRPIALHKARFVLDAMEHYGIRSFADLGGSWGVHGGYAYQALLAFPVERAYLVDDFVPPQVRERFAGYPHFHVVKGSFGKPETVAALPEVEALFLFDILLHQVDPDWGVILDLYTPKAKVILIYNQQWKGSAKTERLLELGPEAYLRNSPFAAGAETSKAAVAAIYASLDERRDRFGGKRRGDAPDIWQWGITDPDLVAKMWSIGFKLDRMQNFGLFSPAMPNFENHGFWFSRR
jgi:hypothetical protein